MSHAQSKIPKLKPARSCGNLNALTKNDFHQSERHLNKLSDKMTGSTMNIHDRASMIDAPVPVTHRRMFNKYNSTLPPWAIDDSISPFDIFPIDDKKQRKTNQQVQKFNLAVQTNLHSEPAFISINNNLTDEHNRTNISTPTTAYKSEIQKYVEYDPLKQECGYQTDVHGHEYDFRSEASSPAGRYRLSSDVPKPEKRIVIPLKELKRTTNKPTSTYKVVKRSQNLGDFTDFGKMNEPYQPKLTNDDVDYQTRVDYWLNRNVENDNPSSMNRIRSVSSLNSSRDTDSHKQLYRNEINFTPRSLSLSNSVRNSPQKELITPPNPQIIDAVILDSDSDSDRENIISSRSIDSRISRPSSHIIIQANLAPKSDVDKSNQKQANCSICGEPLSLSEAIQTTGVRCHGNCFKCFWCRKKLSLESYKINGTKLCCPLHYRLLSN